MNQYKSISISNKNKSSGFSLQIGFTPQKAEYYFRIRVPKFFIKLFPGQVFIEYKNVMIHEVSEVQ